MDARTENPAHQLLSITGEELPLRLDRVDFLGNNRLLQKSDGV